MKINKTRYLVSKQSVLCGYLGFYMLPLIFFCIFVTLIPNNFNNFSVKFRILIYGLFVYLNYDVESLVTTIC